MSTEDEKLLKEAKKLPWEDRLLHKNWKVRNDANIDLAALCDTITDPKDPRLRELGPLFRKTVADSNAPVQEKALDALIAFLRAADADASRYAKEVCDAIVAKCLTGRPKTVEKAQAAFLLWVELEATEVFLEAMEKAIKNKVAKAVVPAIDVMFQALRSEQEKELEQEAVSEVVGTGISEEPTVDKIWIHNIHFILTFAEMYMALISVPQEVDEYELLDPVDILTPLDKTGFWDGVKATKWSERRDAVAELTKLSSAKKIAPGDFSEICRTLKKLVTDINIAVSVEAIQAIGNLARGLRNHFSGSSRFLLPVLLEKLKEKKPALMEALTQTLQTMFKAGCLTLADATEGKSADHKMNVYIFLARDIKVAVKNKVPLVRSLTLNWVTFCIETSNKAVVLKLHKDYVPICMECLNDSTPEVRDASFATLASIAKFVGMKPLEKPLEKLDEVRKKKLSEMIGNSGGGLLTSTGSAPVSTSGGSIACSEVGCFYFYGLLPSSTTTDGSFVRRSAASMLSGKKPIQAAPVSKKSGPVKVSTGKKADGTAHAKSLAATEHEDIEPGEMSLEEIESRLESRLPADLISKMKSSIWKERLEAISLLKQQVEGLGDLDQAAEILIRLLCAVPGWAEKNVQVQQQVIEIITYIASTVTKLPKRCVVLCHPGISERVADIKTRNQAMKCLTTFCEAVGPGLVFDRDLIDFCKDTGLQSSTAATRNSTIKLIGALHKFVGPDIKGFLMDVKPALLSALDAEYEKNPFEGAAAAPKKTIKASDTSSMSSGGLDGLPREDISGKITPILLKNLASPDWKVRLESIESVNKILEEANKRIQMAGTVELLGALRGRLYDSNKNLVMATLATIGAIASAMGPPVEKSSKGILSDMLKCLGDNKKQMRECTLSALDSWFAAVQLDKMVPYITVALADSKLGAEGKKDLFEWLSKNLSGLIEPSEALHLLKPAAAALADKSVDVRKAAEASIAEIMKLNKGLKDMRGPALALVLERLRPGVSPQDASESLRMSSIGLTSKITSKTGKAPLNVSKHVGRAAPMRGIPTRVSKADSIASVQDYAAQSQALFNVKDSNKDDRERIVIRRFKFEEPRLEQIQDLENDLIKYFREDLNRRLLSSDFKKQVEGLELLQKALPSSGKEMIELIDILLRWFVLRLCESNTTCLLKVLEFLPELIGALKDEGYTLSEAEAAIFLPCLIEKVGGQLKSLQHVATLTSERDGEVRKASLNTLATAYKNLGEDVWKYVGKLSDAQKSMLDDRFKWKAREMDKRKEGRPGEARAALRRSVRDNGMENLGLSESHVDRHAIPRSLTAGNGPMDWHEALDIISLGSPEQSVEGMKVVCHELTLATNDSESSSLDELVKDADKLVSCVASMVSKAFDFSLAGASSRSCKYVLNTLMQAFQIKKLAHAVKESTLDNLITELLLWLLDERVPEMDDGSQLLKALNILMLKILDNAERTHSFVVLINLLRPLNPSKWPSPASSESLVARNQKFSDLVVKCLIKLTKVLQSTIYDVDLDRILQSIHVYLQELGMEEIRKRAGADDKPLRMVKTVLHELVKLRGTAIKGHLSMVPIDMEPQPIILAYIDLNLQTLAAARMLTPSGPVGQTHWGDSVSNNPSPATNSADAQLKQELAAVFKKIGDKQTCTIGLYELYRITQLYPKVDIFAQLQNASEAFRTYIRDGLAEMEKNAAAGRTPSNLPMTTPPPAALTLSSPKLTSLPHGNTKLLNIKTDPLNPKLTSAYHEDDGVGAAIPRGLNDQLQLRPLVGEERVERFSSGVTPGTLDAIRERMKSIQAAAAAGNIDSGNRPLMYTNGNVMHSLQSQHHGSDRVDPDIPIQTNVLPMDEKALSGLQARMERLKSGSTELFDNCRWNGMEAATMMMMMMGKRRTRTTTSTPPLAVTASLGSQTRDRLSDSHVEVLKIAREKFTQEISFRCKDRDVSLAKALLYIAAEDEAFLAFNRERDARSLQSERRNAPSSSEDHLECNSLESIPLNGKSISGWLTELNVIAREVEAELVSRDIGCHLVEVLEAVNVLTSLVMGLLSPLQEMFKSSSGHNLFSVVNGRCVEDPRSKASDLNCISLSGLDIATNRDVIGIALANLIRLHWKRASKANHGLMLTSPLRRLNDGNGNFSQVDCSKVPLLRPQELRLAIMASERLLILQPHNWALRRDHGMLLFYSRRYGEAVQELSICMAFAPVEEAEVLEHFIEKLHLLRLESSWKSLEQASSLAVP
ncbi:Protein MOR1 [Acorus gramineus]|uniref:Protein MOR1 n=1 Tax=Acorus gramineus TaxID=55184 RepID=A0AAV9AD22_ACOGR|nr:Protein MOR1 [Acorus gramineus]